VPNHQSGGIEAHWNLISCDQSANAQIVVPRRGEHGNEVLRGREVNRVINGRKRPDTTLEAASPSIDLANELRPQPPFVS
jgi:hypothetical protein